MKSVSCFFLLSLLLVSIQFIYGQDFVTDFKQAKEYYNSGKYAEAGVIFNKWIPTLKESRGENDTAVYLQIVEWAENSFYLAGDYEQAEPLMEEILRIDKEKLGEDHPSYAQDLKNLVQLVYNDLNHYERAEPLMKEVLRIDNKKLGKYHPVYIEDLNDLAQLYQAMGRYEQAEPLQKEVLKISKEVLGEDDPVYATYLNNLALLDKDIGHYEQAEPLMKEALRIAKEKLEEDDPDYATYLNNLALLYKDMGHCEQAEPLQKEALRITKEKLGEDDPSYANILNNLGLLYQEMGRYAQAEPLIKEALQIDKEKLGEDNLSYAGNLSDLAQLFLVTGRYKQAEPLQKEALRIDEEKLGKEHPTYARDLNNLAQLYLDMGLYELAEPLQKEALRIDEEKLGKDHPSYARDLSNLAQLYHAMGRYEQAEQLMKEVVRITKIKLGEDHPSYAGNLSALAELYLAMGRYEQAEPLQKEALRIYKEKLGQNHPYYAACLNNLELLYMEMGRYEQAEPLMKEALRITKEKLGEDHPSYAIALNNLAWLYQDIGRYEQAESLYIESLRIDKEKLGKEHPDYAMSLTSLAQLYRTMGRYEQAESLAKEALRIDKEKLGEDHPGYAIDVSTLARIYKAMGQYGQAELFMKEALRIDKEKLGGDHLFYAQDLNSLAILYQAMGNYEQTKPLMEEVFRIFQYQLKNNTGFLSEKEVGEFLNTFLSTLEIYQSFNVLSQGKDSLRSSTAFAFDIELNRKGILLQALQKLRYRILESGDTSLVNTFNTVLSLKKRVEKLYSLDSTKRYEDPGKIEQQANELEKTLALKSQDYRQSKEDASITWKEIQQHLKTGEAVVEFSSFRFYDKRWTDSIYYCALVLRPGYTAPKMVFQFEERALSKLLNNKSPALKQMLTQVYSPNRDLEDIPSGDIFYPSASLYNLIMKPIENLLYGAKTIYYVPSGLLNRVSFPAIAININERLADKYNLIYLSTSKKLVTQQQEKGILNENTHVALFGGINYEWNSNQQQRLQQNAISDIVASGAGFVPFEKQRNETFDSLPGSRAEVRAIDELCHLHKIKNDLFTDDLATEAQFKSLSGKIAPSILHVASHGFFIPDTNGKSGKDLYRNSKIPGYIYAKDPLLRSGLALAGVRRAWFGGDIPEGMENGILQAKEVSNMDLRNTKLVVLSACETGLGDVKGSEGVFGLQRSFKMAGADYLLMSLWKVPDEATQKLMTMFYENLFSGQPIREAFKNAQTRLRHLNIEYESPYYWGAWVLME